MPMLDNDIPEWYHNILVMQKDDTEILEWRKEEGKKYHDGYCKFCKEQIYGDKFGDVGKALTMMVLPHTGLKWGADWLSGLF